MEGAPRIDEGLLEGQRRVRVVMAIFIGISVLVIGGYTFALGIDRLPFQLVRFGLTLALCRSLHNGSNVARQLAIGLGALAALAAILGGVTAPHGGAAFMAMGAGYSAAVAILLLDPHVRGYFGVAPPGMPPRAKRRKRRKRIRPAQSGDTIEPTSGDAAEDDAAPRPE